MPNNENPLKDRNAVFCAMREVLLNASVAELQAAATEAGLDLRHLAEEGRSVIDSALKNINQQSPLTEGNILLHKGLNSLLIMLRRRDNIDEAELAARANVDEEEVRRIEYDPHYLPSPRTIFKLEKAFSLPSGVLAKLSGAIKANSPCMEERVLEFAANAKAIGKLTKEERELLNRFVRFLSEQE